LVSIASGAKYSYKDAHFAANITAATYTHGTCRHSYDSSDEAYQSLQRNYRFEFVHKLPEQFAGLNN